MERLITCAQSQRLDALTKEAFGLDEPLLMEKASFRLWQSLKPLLAGKSCRIAAVCGKGDNGADALAMLRHAWTEGYRQCEAWFTGQGRSASLDRQRGYLAKTGIAMKTWDEASFLAEAGAYGEQAVILDAVLGSGTRGAARGEAALMIEALVRLKSASGRPRIASIDLPSGLGDEWVPGFPAVRADLTLALHPRKQICFVPGARALCGDIITVDGVFPEDLLREKSASALLDSADFSDASSAIDPEAHKASRGKLAIFAGDIGSLGAARLCASAAARSGAGYVTLYLDESLYPLIAGEAEAFIVKPVSAFDFSKPGCDAILAGPGWGRGEQRAKALEKILALGIPTVLDADALRILAESGARAAMAKPGTLIACPHPGEFEDMCRGAGCPGGNATFLERLDSVAAHYGATVVYRSHVTWIASGGAIRRVWDGMTAELGVAGSGDVLCGLLAGLLASRLASARSGDQENAGAIADGAIARAVAVHGTAGRRLASKLGWFSADELATECAKLEHDGLG